MKRLTNAEKAELHKKLEEAEKAKFKPYENKIAELEKENAELKKQLEHRNCVDCSNHGSNIKLLKAKEIIKNLLFLHNDKFGSTRLEWRCNVVAEAEQFLNEV
jgi:predicted nuclease with TOPRIM domain